MMTKGSKTRAVHKLNKLALKWAAKVAANTNGDIGWADSMELLAPVIKLEQACKTARASLLANIQSYYSSIQTPDSANNSVERRF